MTRRAQVVTVTQRLAPGPAWLRWPVAATATLAWAECVWCNTSLATVVRPWETTGDVVDAMLRAAGWCPACDLCPDCALDAVVVHGEPPGECPACRWIASRRGAP